MTPAELKAARREKGYTQKELAHKFGVSIITVSRWERESSGQRPPVWLDVTMRGLPKKRGTSKLRKESPAHE